MSRRGMGGEMGIVPKPLPSAFGKGFPMSDMIRACALPRAFAARIFVALLSVAFCACAAADDPNRHVVFGTFGTQHLYRGYDGWVEINHGWIAGHEATVDVDNDFIYAPGHPYKERSIVRFYGDDTLPEPLGVYRAYALCDVTSERFSLVPFEYQCNYAPAKVNLTTSGVGKMFVTRTAPVVGQNVYIQEVSGLPQGVTYEDWCEHFRCLLIPGQPRYSPQGAFMIHFRFQASPTAALGTYIVKVKLRTTGFEREVAFPLTIEDVPALATQALVPPEIPTYQKWLGQMKSLGAKWCNRNEPKEIMYFGVESQVWFYDGALVYFQLADQTGEREWMGCAWNIARQYRDYVVAAKGAVPGWRVHPKGLFEAAWRSQDSTESDSYRQALELMVKNGSYSLVGGSVSDRVIRETAYRLETLVYHEVLTGIVNPQKLKSANFLMGMLDAMYSAENYTYQQNFYNGLALRALIDYYTFFGDPRVPVVVKNTLDYIWDKSWRGQALWVNPDNFGARCDWGCRQENTDLINLTAPAYAWYWSITGEEIYQKRADEMFRHALDTDISYSGKVFSQNYTWSPNFVGWRTTRTQ